MTSRRNAALLQQLVRVYQQQLISPITCRALAEYSPVCTRLLATQAWQDSSSSGRSLCQSRGSWQDNQHAAWSSHAASRLFSAQPQPAQDDNEEQERVSSGSHAQASASKHAAYAPHTSSSHFTNEPHQQSRNQGISSTSPMSSSRVMSTLVGEDTAKKCDEIIDSLTSKAEGSRPSTRVQSIAQHIRHYLSLAWNGYLSVQGFVLSIPGAIMHHIALPWAEKKEVYKGWWLATKREVKHYWVGTKLLWADVKIAARLGFKVVQGKTLTRRERRQLTRTIADVFRLVPFAVFIVVPFMEILLPVALKLFPNMLPSTFENKLKKEEEMKKRVIAKMEVARFLQDTVSTMAKDISKSSNIDATQASAAELYQFMKRIRSGEHVNNYEITKFAQLFNDELTLDNLERIHLVNLCRFVGISPFGTDNFLVTRLRGHLYRIKEDDKVIKSEGLDSLTEDELRSACRARGMRAPFGERSGAFMKDQMREWLDLSLNRALPSSLLLLSRAFTVTLPVGGEASEFDSLKDTIGALPNKVINEVGMEATAADGADVAKQYERKLEYLRREEELIREEELEAEALLSSNQPIVQPDQSPQQMAAAAAAAAVVREAAASAVMDVLEGESEEEKSAKLAAAKEEKMRTVISALAVMASSSGVSREREEFMQLVRTEIKRYDDQLAEDQPMSMVFHAGGDDVAQPPELKDAVGPKRLAGKVTTILQRIEKELDAVDLHIGDSMHILDADNDGMISRTELQTAMGFLREQLGEDELRLLLERLNAFNNDDGPFDVGNLMSLSELGGPTSDPKDIEDKAAEAAVAAALGDGERAVKTAQQ